MSRGTIRLIGLALGVLALLGILLSATLIDRRPPFVESVSLSRTAPTGLALTHAALDIAFSEPVVQGSAEARLRIDPAIPGSTTWDGVRTLIFTPDDRFPVATDFRVWLEPGFTDLAGNASETASDPFTFRTVDLPALASSVPGDEATGMALDAPLTLTFDRLMDTERTEDALRLEPAVPFRAVWRGATLMVSPDRPLAPGTRYRLSVGVGAADADGNSLAAPISVDFTTLATGLAPRGVVPADGSAGAPIEGPIALVFDGRLDPDSIADALRLTPTAGGRLTVEEPITDAAGTDTGTTLLVFRPDPPLAPHTTYTVELRPAVVRAEGSDLAAEGRTWSFTTGSGPEVPQNQVLFLAERGGVRNLWAMNPDGSNARQVTGELAGVTAYDVSADGRQVVYAAGGRVLRLSLPDGTTTVLTPEGEADYAPRLLPDGSGVIVGRRNRSTGQDMGFWLRPLSEAGGAVRQLLADGAPPLGSSAGSVLPHEDGRPSPWSSLGAVSADSTTALLVRASGSLVVVRIADGLGLSTGLAEPLGPAAWSSQSEAFLVSATRVSDEATAAWLVGTDRQIVDGPPLGGWLALGAGGEVAGTTPGSEDRLAVVTATSAEPLFVTDDELLDRQPAFSPGGDELVFTRLRPDAPDTSAGIWRVGIDGSALRQLTADGSDPRWLP